MDANVNVRSLPETSVRCERGDILVFSNTYSFLRHIPGIKPMTKDADTALLVRTGPCTLFLSADEALAFAAALEAHAHHFIALATEAHAEAAA